MKLHKRPVLISGKLSTNEIFDLFQTWQLSILSWSIGSKGLLALFRGCRGCVSVVSKQLKMHASPMEIQNFAMYKKRTKVLHYYCSILPEQSVCSKTYRVQVKEDLEN